MLIHYPIKWVTSYTKVALKYYSNCTSEIRLINEENN